MWSRAALWLAPILVAAGGCAAPKTASAPAPEEAALRLPEAPKPFLLVRSRPGSTGSPAPLLLALRRELDRNFAVLKEQNPAPYFLAYEAVADQTVYVQASLGALDRSFEDVDRSLDVDVRVGDPKLDNTHRLSGELDASRELSRSEWLPIEDDSNAIANMAWLATHAEYERAREELVRVRANKQLKVDEEDDSADFTSEPPSTHYEEPASLSLDRSSWEARVRKWSLPFAEEPDILQSKVTLEASAETRYVVSSEGSNLQLSRIHSRIEITASTVAADGMRLERTETLDSPDLGTLRQDDAVLSHVKHVIADLKALRAAPIVEPFVGPAILDGRAAAVFFHEIFGHRVEGQRQKDEEEGQTFAHKIGEAVMPPFLDVFDDPSASFLNGTPLGGHYPYDDEGIAAQRASLVERGVLRGFVLSRSPVHGFPRSNGHGRRERGHRVVARQGNLIVDPRRTTTPQALKQRLLEELHRSGRPYGLRFHEITGGYTNTTRSGAQAFKVLPVMVYRVYPDGREQLVRGVDLEGTPLAALSRIEAAANDFQVFNGICGAESGWVPVSATSPSLLITQIEVTRQEKSHDRPPLLPPPRIRDLRERTQ